MKRKLTTILSMALSVALLCGCGATGDDESERSNSSTESIAEGASNSSTNDSTGGFFDNLSISTPGTLSGCLSTGKVIAYEVETVDKAKTPKNVYFFQDGKVTIIPGNAFGLTMGDYAKMSDDEIWATYETVRAAYIESYTAQKIKEYKNSINSEINQPQWVIESLEPWVDGISAYNDDPDYVFTALDFLAQCSQTDEDAVRRFSTLEKCLSGEMSLQEGVDFFLSEAPVVLSEANATLAQLQAELDAADSYPCPTPFCDMPFQFMVETDASGNKVQSESLLYPTLSYSISGEVPNKLYSTLTFALGLTCEYQIYETTYNTIALSGSGRFCTRETMDTDTLESKNILVDPKSEEKNALFKDEVTARYQ